MIERQQGQAANPAAPVNFEIGEYVKVESGAFAGAAGPITQIKQDKGLIYIESEMLGKKTEIPVSVLDVKKQ
jgi:transcription antitermination factor NusG